MSPKKKIRADGSVLPAQDEEMKGEEVTQESQEAEAADAAMQGTNGEHGAQEPTKFVARAAPTPRLENLQPSDWFRTKLQAWREDVHAWHKKHLEIKSPNKASMMGALCKAPPATKPEPVPEKKQQEAELKKKKEHVEVDENKDPMQQLEEEIDREDVDVFGIQDICDMEGGTPLFSEFAFEDWALLSLRFELHLLVHAFMHDANDTERKGIHPDHLAFYYNKYYKRELNPKKYGVESVDDVIDLVKDTVLIGARTRIVESLLTADVECNEIFVKLTESARRDRHRRIDAGEEKAALKFSRPARNVGLPAMGLAAGNFTGAAGGPMIVRPKQWNAKVAPPVKAPPVKSPPAGSFAKAPPMQLPMGGGNNSWQRMPPGGYNNSWQGQW